MTGGFRVRATTLVGFPVVGDPHRPRRTMRVDLKLEIHFRNELQFAREYVANLSSGGIFVPTHFRAALDDEVLLTVTLPNGDALNTPATVVRVIDHPPPGGVCMSFSRRDPAFEAALHAYFLTLGRQS